jgi:hypothetical protein
MMNVTIVVANARINKLVKKKVVVAVKKNVAVSNLF